MLFVGIAENREGVFLVYSIPGAISLGGFAAIYQYMKGACAGRAWLFLLIGGVAGATLGYAYTGTLLDLYADLGQFAEDDPALVRFLGAIVISLFAASIAALVGGFSKKN